jgi:cellobiose-specific phosphotransferase system component IIC
MGKFLIVLMIFGSLFAFWFGYQYAKSVNENPYIYGSIPAIAVFLFYLYFYKKNESTKS